MLGEVPLGLKYRGLVPMSICDLMWELFQRTGHIGAYLLYCEYNSHQTLEAAAKDAEEKDYLLKENDKNGVV